MSNLSPNYDVNNIIPERLIQFTCLLRENGFCIGQSELKDAIHALNNTDLLQPHLLVSTLKPLFCNRLSELSRFDEIFNAYWFGHIANRRTNITSKRKGSLKTTIEGRGQGSKKQHGGLAKYFDWAQDDNESTVENEVSETKSSGGSRVQNREKVDFGKVTDPDEIEQLASLAERWGAQLRYRLSRRRKLNQRGITPDLRKTFRQSVSTGGIPVKLSYKKKKRPPIRLVIFIDVSGSMDMYSLFFTRFTHALTGVFTKAEVFIFHTKLVQITGTLKEANPVRLMEKMSLISQGWSGGTKISEALETFNNKYARHITNSRTVAVIFSDGYDTGKQDNLLEQIKQLKKNCYRLIWLNPLLGRDTYQPYETSLHPIISELDLFAPAHNLESLSALENTLAGL